MSTPRMMPYWHNGRFYNYKDEALENWYLSSARLLIQSLYARQFYDNSEVHKWIEHPKLVERSYEPRITWLGHSTFLIQIANINILTDPIFGALSFAFPRILPCGVACQSLPAIDLVLISHNHPDHLDIASLSAMRSHNPLLLVPRGDKQLLHKRNFMRVQEFVWWDRHILGEVTCTFLPANHWSQRGLFDRNKSLWGSWMIEFVGYAIYFAGDTAYGPHFSNISHYFPAIDMALLPIGPCEPRQWMVRTHISAEEAGDAFLALKARNFVPMHWGAYQFGTDSFLGPLNRITAWWQKQNNYLLDKQLHILKAGAMIVPSAKVQTQPESYLQT